MKTQGAEIIYLETDVPVCSSAGTRVLCIYKKDS